MKRLYPLDPSNSYPATPVELPKWSPERMRDPANYLRDEGLADAVNVALTLRQPLMVTGEPGTGKTLLASSIAWELGLDQPLIFETKSSSQARDLFYEYDALGRFSARDTDGDRTAASNFIAFKALGEAIVKTNTPDDVRDILPGGKAHRGKTRSVVLIDEIEKAPRDFPNDILNEIERMYFRIPELGNRLVAADPDFHPIVVMTNNSEKSLPDAFLRRCIYYHIPFPDEVRLQAIVLNRISDTLPDVRELKLARDAVQIALQLREDALGLEKKPGTAEILNWVSAMLQLGAPPDRGLDDPQQRTFAKRSVSALTKIGTDQSAALRFLSTTNNNGTA